MYWGGLDFMNALGKFADVQKSSVEPSVYLINPESNDLRNFAPFKEPKTAKTETNQEPFKLPDVNKFLQMLNGRSWKPLLLSQQKLEIKSLILLMKMPPCQLSRL